METELTYKMRDWLREDMSPNGSITENCATFMLGSRPVAEWVEKEGRAGAERHLLFPAFSVEHGGRCWLDHWQWLPGEEYSAEGAGEALREFEWGVKKLIELGKFNFPVPSSFAEFDMEE